MRLNLFLVITVLLLGSCRTADDMPPRAGDRFWNELQQLCGKAFEGRMTVGTEPSDEEFGAQRMVMHVRQCSASEILIPFFVGENRSRTWIVTRLNGGFRLKHDHRHEDGSEDEVTQYGGDTVMVHDEPLQEFHADEFTGRMLPASAQNIWTMEVDPGRTFAYQLRRPTGRRFRVEFDLTRTVPPPPAPWGY